MDLARIFREVAAAQAAFPNTEYSSTTDGKPLVLAALQTSAGGVYTLSVMFPDYYPSGSPKILVRKPTLLSPPNLHRYPDGTLCYIHPNMWNPSRHDCTCAMAKAAKWINKYEVWRVSKRWPGAEMAH